MWRCLPLICPIYSQYGSGVNSKQQVLTYPDSIVPGPLFIQKVLDSPFLLLTMCPPLFISLLFSCRPLKKHPSVIVTLTCDQSVNPLRTKQLVHIWITVITDNYKWCTESKCDFMMQLNVCQHAALPTVHPYS